jgi:ubiquinone/menaquinone biosynthesis C-methylase UbiE
MMGVQGWPLPAADLDLSVATLSDLAPMAASGGEGVSSPADESIERKNSMKGVPVTHGRVFSDGEFAARYAKQHQKMGENLGREIATKLRARGFEAGRIIDVGCGSGATAIALAQEFPKSEIVGIDLSELLLNLATQAAQVAGLVDRVRFERGDAERISFEDDSFDIVLNLNMVHIVNHPIDMLEEIERILAPDGALFIIDLRRSWLGLFEKEMKSALTLQEAKVLLAQSKLRAGEFSSSLIWWKFET